jgi:hypothetical protein
VFPVYKFVLDFSEIKLGIVQFCNHAFDFKPNCTPLTKRVSAGVYTVGYTPLTSITIISHSSVWITQSSSSNGGTTFRSGQGAGVTYEGE